MSEAQAMSRKPPVLVESFIERALRAHPIWLREARQSSRLQRTPWVLFALTLVVTLGLSAFGAVAVGDHVSPSTIGAMVFQAFFSIAYIVVVLAGSAIAANAIAVEREGRTFEALQLTGLTPARIARQKFASSYTQLVQYILALAPVGAMAFVFGGVTTTEVVLAYGLLFVIGALSVGFGLALSSLMPNMRAALLSTIALSVIAGPALWSFFGFAGSSAAHHLWRDVPEAHPIWMPLAYSRAPFGARYVVLLLAAPAVLFGVPGWLTYEVTVANLASDADDRSTGYKRWFLVSTVACAALVLAVASLGESGRDRVEVGLVGVGLLSLLFAFGAFLLAGDPVVPSRKVTQTWAESGASRIARALGPGVTSGAVLFTVWGLGVALATSMGLVALGATAATRNSLERPVEQLFVFVAYTSAFFIFLVGFVAALRARGVRPLVTRAVAGGALLLVGTVPWVVAAIAAVAGGSKQEAVALAAPSPFYAVVMMSEIHSYSYSSSAGAIIGTGVVAILGWSILGLSLLAYASAKRRAS